MYTQKYLVTRHITSHNTQYTHTHYTHTIHTLYTHTHYTHTIYTLHTHYTHTHTTYTIYTYMFLYYTHKVSNHLAHATNTHKPFTLKPTSFQYIIVHTCPLMFRHCHTSSVIKGHTLSLNELLFVYSWDNTHLTIKTTNQPPNHMYMYM